MPKMILSGTGASAKTRVIVSLTALALALLLLVVMQANSRPAEAVDSDNLLLPDLGMAKLRGFQIEETSDGRKLLRFTSIVVNVGDGPFEAHGQRRDTTVSTMTTTQRIFDGTGDYLDHPTDAVMYYSGDGHNHWHLRDLEDFELIRLDNGNSVGMGAKHGFCFFDNYRYGSEEDALYPRKISCGMEVPKRKRPDALNVMMGLSRGWGDAYYRWLPDQYIDVTGLRSGRYRLWATADADNWFRESDDSNRESDDSNNVTWVELQLNPESNSVRVVTQGPSAQPITS